MNIFSVPYKLHLLICWLVILQSLKEVLKRFYLNDPKHHTLHYDYIADISAGLSDVAFCGVEKFRRFTLHYIVSHFIKLHYVTLRYITLGYTILHDMA